MKINKSKEIDILIDSPWKFGESNRPSYTIVNKSHKTYIIDPYGFSGDSYWLFNSEKLNPIDFSRGYYTRHSDDDCKNALIVIHPKQKINAYLSLNDSDGGRYDLSKSGKYFLNIKSNHTRQNGMPLSCKHYIDELEIEGYKFLEDSIVAKIPFIR
jgi:hypothetical protein